MSPATIAHFSFHLYLAGAQRYVKIISANGYGSLFVAVGPQKRADAQEEALSWFSDIGVEVVFVADIGVEALVQKLNEKNIDIVVSHSLESDIWTYEHQDAVLEMKRRWAIYHHGRWLQGYRNKSPKFTKYVKSVMERADRLLDPCPRYQEEMLKESCGAEILKKVRHVTYGAEPMKKGLSFVKRSDYGIPDGKDVVVFALFGRMIKEKGPATAVTFINLLNGDGYKAHLLLVGKGEEWDRLKKEQPPNVTFIEAVSNTQIFKEAFDVGLCIGNYEGETGPMVPLENAVMGKATLATDTGNAALYLSVTMTLVIELFDAAGNMLLAAAIAHAAYERAVTNFYDADKCPDHRKIGVLGKRVHDHWSQNYSPKQIVAPYDNGALSF